MITAACQKMELTAACSAGAARSSPVSKNQNIIGIERPNSMNNHHYRMDEINQYSAG
jgi:hypothetical protein